MDLQNIGVDDPEELSSVQNQLSGISPEQLQTLANAGFNIASLFPGVQNLLSNGQLNASQSAYANAIQAINQSVPSQLSNFIPKLTQQVMQGTMTAAQAQTAIQQQSALAGIQIDPAAMNAQTQALTQLQKVATDGGLTAQDKAQLNDLNNQVNSQNRGRQLAVQSQSREQGIGGSGADLAARLSAAQGANQAASTQATDVAGNAQARALQAMLASGQLGGQIQNEQFGEAAQKASAQDAINQFNTALKQQTNQQNTADQQQANLTNFNTANTIAGNNTNIANTQAMLPLQTAAQQNNQNLNWAGTTARADQQQGAQLNTQANTNRANNTDTWGNVIKAAPAIANAAGSLWDDASSWFSDKRLKEDKGSMTSEEVDDLMHQLTDNRFRYKKGSVADDGGKVHYGVMAQDLEKTPAADSVVDTPYGKKVKDTDSKQNMTIAVLKNVHERLKAGGL
jgi:hypothetical protein